MQVERTLNSLDYTIRSIEDVINYKTFYQDELENIKVNIENLDKELKFVQGCKELYINAVDVLYERSIGTLKDTLDTALQYVMFDKNYSVNIKVDDKCGNKTLEISVWDNDKEFEADVVDGSGQGIRTIISFVLKMYYLLNENSRILFLDEKYSALSAQYVPLFFDFIKRMTEEKNFIIVMITHDTRFQAYADRVYSVNDGQVQLLEIGNADK